MYQFGPFVFDCQRRRLYRGGQRVQVTTKAMQLMEILIEARPQVVSKEDLIRQIWPEGVGTEANLTVNVSALRKALGERSGDNEYVVTLPTRGYSFAAPVVDLEAKQMPSESGRDLELHLAVMPPRVFGLEAGEAYLAHGIADALIAELAQQPQLAVRPITAVLDPRISSLDPTQVARSLRVALVLSGALERRDGELQLRLELSRPEDGIVLWARALMMVENQTEALATVVRAQIAEVLQLPTSQAMIQLPRPPRNSQAFQLYLQGRFHLHRMEPEGVKLSLEFFERAVELEDGSNPRALASIALAHLYLVYFGITEPAESYPLAEEVLYRALALDDSSAMANAVLGMTLQVYRWDWEGADRAARRAIELGPLDSRAHEYRGYQLLCAGEVDSAELSLRRALDLDPSSLLLLCVLSWCARMKGQYQTSEELINTVLGMDPKFLVAHYHRACTLVTLDRFEEALAMLESFEGNPYLDPLIGYAQSGLGDEKGLESSMQRIREHAGSRANVELNQAVALISHPDTDRCLTHLEAAADLHHGTLATIAVDPLWQRQRSNPRFLTLLGRIRPATLAEAE